MRTSSNELVFLTAVFTGQDGFHIFDLQVVGQQPSKKEKKERKKEKTRGIDPTTKPAAPNLEHLPRSVTHHPPRHLPSSPPTISNHPNSPPATRTISTPILNISGNNIILQSAYTTIEQSDKTGRGHRVGFPKKIDK